MRNYSTVLKIAPAFLLAGAILQAQTTDTLRGKTPIKEAEIEQVVLVGYGKQKKSDLTGSVTALGEKDFNKGAIVNTQQMLQGKTAGVTISNDGSPGGSSTVRIRGLASLSGNNDPLYVVDGVPLDNNGISGASNPLNSINPNDIESISILKDASATAIYGVRASGGVIIITTKKGTKGGWRFNYSGNLQIYTLAKKHEVYDSEELINIVTNNLPDKVDMLGYTNSSDDLVYANTDWQDEIFETAYGTDQNFSARGNLFGGTTPFRASAGYTNSNGILKTSNFERMNVGFGMNPKLLDGDLTFNINAKGIKSNYRYANNDAIRQAISMDPTKPVKMDDDLYADYGGYFQWLTDNGTYVVPNQNVGLLNPVATLMGTNDKAEISQFIGNIEAEYKIPFIEGLSFVANAALDYSESDTNKTQAAYLTAVNGSTGAQYAYAGKGRQVKRNQNLDTYFKYFRNFDSGVLTNLGVTAGYNYQKFVETGHSYTNLNDPDLYSYNWWGPTTGVMLGFFGRANLTFVDKYLLTVTARREATSRYAKDYRWGTFPSASFAWKMKEEDWLKDNNFFSDLKLRMGWGITGNQDVGGWYQTVPSYNTTNSDLAQFVAYPNGTSSDPVVYHIINPNKYNSNIQWETTTQYNVGFDYGIKNNKISGSLDYWKKEIEDVLYYSLLPAGANYDLYLDTNIATMASQGIDFDVNLKLVNTSKVRFEMGGNISWVDMELTKLNRQGTVDASIGGLSGLVQNPTSQAFSVGHVPYEWYMYKQAYDTSGNPLEGVFVDMDGDGTITEADKYHTNKSPFADFLYGFNTFLKVGNFDFTTVWRGSVGNYAYNNVNARMSTLSYIDFEGFDAIRNTVTNLNNTNFVDAPGSFQMDSDLYLEEASFLKLDNITLGYNFRNFFKTNAKVRLYGSVQNVFTITDYSGIDPEVGIDWNVYPRSRTFTFGVNVDF